MSMTHFFQIAFLYIALVSNKTVKIIANADTQLFGFLLGNVDSSDEIKVSNRVVAHCGHHPFKISVFSIAVKYLAPH